MPIRRADRRSRRRLGAVISCPSTMIRPASIGSSRLMQRSSVDLPEPEAPIRHTTSCSATDRSIPCSTSRSPKRLVERPRCGRASAVTAHARLPALAGRGRPASRRTASCGIVITRNRTAATTYGVKLKCRPRRSMPRRAGTPRSTPTDGDERGVLLQADEVVQQRRDHAAHGLREHDEPHRLAAREARATARPPPGSGAPTRCPPGTPRPRRRSRRGSERRPPRRTVPIGTPLDAERGHPEPEQVDDEDRRDPPEQVGVDDGAAAGSGRTPGPGRLRITATTSASTRIRISAMMKTARSRKKPARWISGTTP